MQNLSLLLLVLSLIASHVIAKPNVVFILADDLGIGDLGCYGQKILKTPNIDRLATEGLQFSDHYSGSTVCAPSRSVLMTGQHTGHTPVRGNRSVGKRPDGSDPRALPEGCYTMPGMFRAAGYRTGMFGKWGLGSVDNAGNALKQGFDQFYGYYSQSHAHTYYPMFLYDNDEKIALDGETYSHDLIWNTGLQFIRAQAKAGMPFFCYYSITVPHASMTAPDALHEKWRKVLPDHDQRVGRYGGEGMGKDRVIQNPIAGFAAMMENLDNQVGQLLALLEEMGIDDNTMVIFCSDNGTHKEGGHDPEFWDSNGPLRGTKRDLTEGGIRTPLLVRWPDAIAAGRKSAHVSAFWDFLPTFADMIGSTIPESAAVDGISLLPELSGHSGEQEQHKVLYWAFNERGPKQAVRFGKWKLIRHHKNKTGEHKIELYNLETDIGEERNLAQAHPEITSQGLKLMDAEHVESSYYPITLR